MFVIDTMIDTMVDTMIDTMIDTMAPPCGYVSVPGWPRTNSIHLSIEDFANTGHVAVYILSSL